MRSAILAAALGLVVVALSGCADTKNPPETPPASFAPSGSATTPPSLPPTINRTVDIFSLRPLLVDCDFMMGALDLPRSDVQGLLPPGYNATGNLGPLFADINFFVFACSSFVANNETVIPDVLIASVDARVQTNESLRAGAGGNFYNLDFLATNESVLAIFEATGLTSTLASISLSASESSVELEVSTEDGPRYQLSSAQGIGEAPEITIALRSHRISNGQVRWHDYDVTYQMPAQGGPGQLRAFEGPLASIAPGGQETIAVSNFFGPLQGEIRFTRFSGS